MKLTKLFYVASLLVLLSGITLTTEAQRPRDARDARDARDGRYGNGYGREQWDALGQSFVDGNRDHDNIRVNSRNTFRAIQLRVQGGDIEFQRVVVHFENGEDTDVEIRDRIRAGGQTRAIDLPGNNRRIKSVEVWYSNGNWGRRKPNLRLYGRR